MDERRQADRRPAGRFPRSAPSTVRERSLSTEGHGTKSIIAAFCANLGIAVAKFIGFLLTASGSLLAEAIHSLADTGNQGLLLLGGRRARHAPTAEHPFGFGRERYFWAFVVAMVLFTVGGAFAVLEGIDKVRHPHEISDVGIAIAILVVAIALEGFSFRTALHEARAQVGPHTPIWRYIRRSKAPEVPVVLLEDAAALCGLGIALVAIALSAATGDAVWDGIGTIVIGCLLICVATILAIEMKSLLIGESAAPDRIRAITGAIVQDPSVRTLIHLRTEHLGPDDLIVLAKIAFDDTLAYRDLTVAIDRVERRIRDAEPAARLLFVEPDVDRPASEAPIPGGEPEVE